MYSPNMLFNDWPERAYFVSILFVFPGQKHKSAPRQIVKGPYGLFILT